MDAAILKSVGQVAGVAGLGIGLVILVFRQVIAKNIFPNLTKDQEYKLLRMIVFLSWTIAVIGIAAWVYVSVATANSQDDNNRALQLKRLDKEISSRLSVFEDYVTRAEADGFTETKTVWVNKALDELAPRPTSLVSGEPPPRARSLHKVFPEYKDRTLPSLLIEIQEYVPEGEQTEIRNVRVLVDEFVSLDFRAPLAGPGFPTDDKLNEAIGRLKAAVPSIRLKRRSDT